MMCADIIADSVAETYGITAEQIFIEKRAEHPTLEARRAFVYILHHESIGMTLFEIEQLLRNEPGISIIRLLRGAEEKLTRDASFQDTVRRTWCEAKQRINAAICREELPWKL